MHVLPARLRLWLAPILLTLMAFGSPVAALHRIAAIPMPPTNVQATDGSIVGSVMVTWNGVAGATFYHIYRGVQHSGSYSHIGTAAGIGMYSDTTVNASVRYEYMVAACNSQGCGGQSASNVGYSGILAPAGVSASDGSLADKILVTWTAAPDATSYRVYRGANPGDPGSSVYIGTTSVSHYYDGVTSPGQPYFYWAKSYNSHTTAVSGYSNGDGGHRKLATPYSVTASDGVPCDGVEIHWGAVEGAASYTVRRGSAGKEFPVTWSDIGFLMHTDTSAAASLVYPYQVKACRPDTGCGDYSASTNGYHGPPPAPDPLKASDGTHGDRIDVQLTTVTGAESYRLYRGLQPGGTSLLAEMTKASYGDHAVQPETVYHYEATACNRCGCGPATESDSGYAQADSPTVTPTGEPPSQTPTPTIEFMPSSWAWLPLALRD